MILDIKITEEENTIDFQLADLEKSLNIGFDVLQKIGAFSPIDSDGWIKSAEDKIWSDLKSFKNI